MLNASRARTARGFTLVELVTTLVIVGILGSVAVAHMFDNRAFGERGYVDEVASTLRYAQRIAVASNCEVAVSIGADTYNVAQPAAVNCNNNPSAWPTQVRRGDGTLMNGAAPTDVTLAPATTVVFRSDGSVRGGSPPAIGTGPFSIVVDGTSGRVVVTP